MEGDDGNEYKGAFEVTPKEKGGRRKQKNPGDPRGKHPNSLANLTHRLKPGETANRWKTEMQRWRFRASLVNCHPSPSRGWHPSWMTRKRLFEIRLTPPSRFSIAETGGPLLASGTAALTSCLAPRKKA